MKPEALTGGFDREPEQAAKAYRTILEAMARPGQVQAITGAVPPAPLSVAAGTVLLTLTDGTTPLHLAGPVDCPAVRDWVAFHIGAPIVSAEAAQFAVGRWPDLQPLDRFHPGDPDYPDRSATLIVLTQSLSGRSARLTGPGIQTEAYLPLPEIKAFERNSARFPLGLDFLFTAEAQIAGLPRTTKVEAV